MRVISPITAIAAFALLAHSAPSLAQSRNDPKTMIRLWGEANSQCRGGSGDDPKTTAACEEREAYGKRIDQLGWCYGKRGEAGYQHTWHRCEGRSLRPGQ